MVLDHMCLQQSGNHTQLFTLYAYCTNRWPHIALLLLCIIAYCTVYITVSYNSVLLEDTVVF